MTCAKLQYFCKSSNLFLFLLLLLYYYYCYLYNTQQSTQLYLHNIIIVIIRSIVVIRNITSDLKHSVIVGVINNNGCAIRVYICRVKCFVVIRRR